MLINLTISLLSNYCEMSRPLDLPPEIVLWVFESLDNIDDALHLARCCKIFSLYFRNDWCAVEDFQIHHRRNTLKRHKQRSCDI